MWREAPLKTRMLHSVIVGSSMAYNQQPLGPFPCCYYPVVTCIAAPPLLQETTLFITFLLAVVFWRVPSFAASHRTMVDFKHHYIRLIYVFLKFTSICKQTNRTVTSSAQNWRASRPQLSALWNSPSWIGRADYGKAILKPLLNWHNHCCRPIQGGGLWRLSCRGFAVCETRWQGALE